MQKVSDAKLFRFRRISFRAWRERETMFTIVFRLLGLVGFCSAALAATDLDREIVLTPQGGAAAEDVGIARWQERARTAAPGAEAFEQLAWAYVAKARRTLDDGYYKLAEKTADVLDAQFGVRAETRLVRGHVLHNLHRFREAEALARALVAERSAPADLALLSDVLIEQGNLAEGVAALQRFVDLQPGTEAYSRVSYVRWLKGDPAGAMAAMRDAERACGIRDTGTRAWTVVRLSALCLQAGDAAGALAMAESALRLAPDFAPALLARGRAWLALGRNSDAADALQRAAELNPLPEYQWWLADALRAANRAAEAGAVEATLTGRGAAGDPRTLALFLATRGEGAPLAVRLAREELAQRADLFSHDALAWALLANGEAAAADAEMRHALAEGTVDARLFFHAGEVARANGRIEEARRRFDQAHEGAWTLTPSERARLEARRGGVVARQD
ncbi:MAG: tetratricopeptide repeat protein [Opitutus sp.]|nr:tetratricopeptide repeat protein [Opitutus sp.]